MEGFFFEDILEKAGLHPWWEKGRHFFAKLMVAVSVYVITSVEYDEVRCVPFSINTTTSTPDGTCGYGSAQAAFVNAQCSLKLPWVYREFGLILFRYAALAYVINSSWLMFPTVINAINEAKRAISENKEFQKEVVAIGIYLVRSCFLVIYLIVFAAPAFMAVIIHPNIFNFECSIAPQISYSIAGQYSCNFPRHTLVRGIATGNIFIILCQAFSIIYGIWVVHKSDDSTFKVFYDTERKIEEATAEHSPLSCDERSPLLQYEPNPSTSAECQERL